MRFEKLEKVSILFIVFITAYIRWGRQEGFIFDSGRNLLEFYMYALGRFPYKDFTLQYPPFFTFFTGYFLKLFGATYQSAQMAYVFLGFVFCFLQYHMCMLLMPRTFALITFFIVFCVESTFLSWVNLFALQSPTPQVLPCIVGMQLFVVGGIRALRMYEMNQYSVKNFFLMSLGSLVALTSKQEGIVFVFVVAVVFVWIKREQKKIYGKKTSVLNDIGLMSVFFMPVFLIYMGIGYTSGFCDMFSGLRAYGISYSEGNTFWWLGWEGVLTLIGGLGLLYVYVFLGLGFLFFKKMPYQKNMLFMTMVLSVFFSSLYFIYHVLDQYRYISLSVVLKRELSSHALVTLPGFLAAFLCVLTGLYSFLKNKKIDTTNTTCIQFFFGFICVFSNVRMFFDHFQSSTFYVPSAVAVPFLMPGCVVFVLYFVKKIQTRISTQVCFDSEKRIFVGLLIYAVCVSLPNLINDLQKSYVPFKTRAGITYVPSSYDTSMYSYLEKKISEGDMFYSPEGGLNFALQTPTPFFMTQEGTYVLNNQKLTQDVSVFSSGVLKYALLREEPRKIKGSLDACSFLKTKNTKHFQDIPSLSKIRNTYQVDKKYEGYILYKSPNL